MQLFKCLFPGKTLFENVFVHLPSPLITVISGIMIHDWCWKCILGWGGVHKWATISEIFGVGLTIFSISRSDNTQLSRFIKYRKIRKNQTYGRREPPHVLQNRSKSVLVAQIYVVSGAETIIRNFQKSVSGGARQYYHEKTLKCWSKLLKSTCNRHNPGKQNKLRGERRRPVWKTVSILKITKKIQKWN